MITAAAAPCSSFSPESRQLSRVSLLCSSPQLKISVFVHMRSNTGADGRDDEELNQVKSSCSTFRLQKYPCPADFGQSIFKSSLKSFRLKLLFQRSMRRQHISPCVKAHHARKRSQIQLFLNLHLIMGDYRAASAVKLRLGHKISGGHPSDTPCREML